MVSAALAKWLDQNTYTSSIWKIKPAFDGHFNYQNTTDELYVFSLIIKSMTTVKIYLFLNQTVLEKPCKTEPEKA